MKKYELQYKQVIWNYFPSVEIISSSPCTLLLKGAFCFVRYNMSLQVWKTLFTDDLDLKQYLYHYTTIDKAIRIINSEQLWFSRLTNLNDTTESKLKIAFNNGNSKNISINDKRTKEITKYLSESNDGIRLLCFSQDINLPKSQKTRALKFHKNHEKDKYFDFTGRGFALPRMWAQYASNHEGICFIVNKHKFDEKLKNLLYCRQSKVKYENYFKPFSIDEKKLDSLYQQVTYYYSGDLSFFHFLTSDDHFVNYNYFTKQKDWENEHEYRYISFVNHETKKEIKIENLFDFLEGIVIGEKIDPAYENVIRNIVDNRCDIKKIHFCSGMCNLD